MAKQPLKDVSVYLMPGSLPDRPIVVEVRGQFEPTTAVLALSVRDADAVADAILRATRAMAATVGF